MLTPVNTFLLGLIANGPINPYDIVARFEFNRFTNILSVPESTIYANIRSMCKKGYIQYELLQDTSMPAKKMYSITPAGLEELRMSLASYLSGYSQEWGGFTVSLVLMHHFSREELLELLNQRTDALLHILHNRNQDHAFILSMQQRVPCIPNLAGSLHAASIVREELETTQAVAAMVEQAQQWPQNTFHHDDMYNRNAFREWLDQIRRP